jgi:hypothetical protein
MKENDQDPFAKYDKLFEEQDRKAAQDTATTDAKNKKSFKAIENRTNKPIKEIIKPKNATRIILTVVFAILIFQAIPFIALNTNGLNIHPIFLTVFIIVFINIMIKAFKR